MSGLTLFVRTPDADTDEVVVLDIDATARDVLVAVGRFGKLLFQGEEVDGSLADAGVCPQSRLELQTVLPWDFAQSGSRALLRHVVLGTTLQLDSHGFTFHETGDHDLFRMPWVGLAAPDPIFWAPRDWPAIEPFDDLIDEWWQMTEEPRQSLLQTEMEHGGPKLRHVEVASFQGGVLFAFGHGERGGRPLTVVWLQERGFVCLQTVDDDGDGVFQAWEVKDGQGVQRLSWEEAGSINDQLMRKERHLSLRGDPVGRAGSEEMGENLRPLLEYDDYFGDDYDPYDYPEERKRSRDRKKRHERCTTYSNYLSMGRET